MFWMHLQPEIVMDDDMFQNVLSALTTLRPAQLAALEVAVRNQMAAVVSEQTADPPAPSPVPTGASSPGTTASIASIEATFAAAPECPHCASTSVRRWGSANRLRRYRCKQCSVTFNALTGTPLAQLHKRELWAAHAQTLVEGISLRKVATRIGVDLTTAFRWRHRFLKAPKGLKAKRLEGTVEADETFFLYSEKGARKLRRPARKRGGVAKKRGVSGEQVPVLIARDRNAATTDEILKERSTRAIEAVLKPVVAKSAILVSDGARAYQAFAFYAGLPHIALNLSAGERTRGIYHIQNVNNYCSRLKGWMQRFNGVATKYLDSYLGWHRINDREGNTLDASRMLAAAWG